MTREERLQYCKLCKNKKVDFLKGLLCNLTGEYADFDIQCSNFVIIEGEKIKSSKKNKRSPDVLISSEKVTKKDLMILFSFSLSITFLSGFFIYTGTDESFSVAFFLGIMIFFSFVILPIIRDPQRAKIHFFEDLKFRILFIVLIIGLHSLYGFLVYPFFTINFNDYLILFIMIFALSFLCIGITKLLLKLLRMK